MNNVIEMILDTSDINLTHGIITVKVVGVATIAAPVIGRLMIIKIPEINCPEYPYDFITCPEIFLKLP